MEYAMRVTPFRLPLIDFASNRGDLKMEELTKRVGMLEKHTQQIQQDVAVLTARSENFATKDDLGQLELRIDGKFEKMERRFDDKLEKLELRIDDKLEKMEQRIDVKFERMDEKFEKKFVRIDEKFEKLNDRLTWSIMVPAILAVLAWFVKDLVVKI